MSLSLGFAAFVALRRKNFPITSKQSKTAITSIERSVASRRAQGVQGDKEDKEDKEKGSSIELPYFLIPNKDEGAWTYARHILTDELS